MGKKKLICVLRVKDGIFFAKEWLDRMETLVDEIVVVDNGSTDGTYELLESHPKVTDITRTEGFDEGRDKNLVYEMARKRNPDWLIWLDIDEVIEDSATREQLDKLMDSSLFNKYSMRRYHFVDRERYAASLKWLYYIASHDRLIWRESPTGYFENVIIDSPNVKGIKGIAKPIPIRIKHLGYINKAIVDRKADIYRKIVPEKEKTFQNMYLQGVKSWKWMDQRNSFKARLTDLYLDFLNTIKYMEKAYRKGKRLIVK